LIITPEHRDITILKNKSPNLFYIDVPDLARREKKSIRDTFESLVSEVEKKCSYKFVGVDGISKLVKPYVLRDIVAAEVAADKKKDPSKPEWWHDPDLPEQRDYNRVTDVVYGWVERLRTAAINQGFCLLFTFRERVYTWKEENGSFHSDTVPDVSPELRRLIEYEFDFLFRLGGKVRSLLEKVNGRVRGAGTQFVVTWTTRSMSDAKSTDVKDRYMAVPDGCTNLTVKSLFDYFAATPHAAETSAEAKQGR